MHALPPTTVHRPASLAEACTVLAATAQARLIAGGTDLLPNLRRGLEHPAALVDLSAVQDMADFAAAPEGGWLLGAGLTLARIASDTAITQVLPTLSEAARAAAGPGHRSASTLGGNLCQDTRCIFYNQSAWWRAANGYCLKRDGDTCHVAPHGARCHAAFSGDLAPVLLVLRAEAELMSARGTRWLPLDGLYRDDGAAHLTLAADEVLARVRVPAAPPGLATGYRKARVRDAMDFPLAGVAVALACSDGVLEQLAIAISGIASRPVRVAGLDGLLGQPVDDTMLGAIGKAVQKQVSPMRSTITESNYRRQVASTLAQRLVQALAHGAAPSPAMTR
ncbi:MAG: 4-hydroxybenzoyl-CoA reductase subunit beta [Dokdonella sp.]|nr:4-hydroxybenzoyl-CoA reductase subunit beta [Dokdonella sp.]